MGLLYHKYLNAAGKIVDLREAAVSQDADNDAPEANTSEADTDTSADQTQDNNTETNTDNQNDNNQQNNETQDNNSADDDLGGNDAGDLDAGGDPGDDLGGDDTSADSSGSDTGSETEEEVDEIKKTEEEMFSNLSQDQLDIKHKELKNKYLDMYDMTNDIIDRIGMVTIEEDITFAIDYVSTTLSNLREMVVDYINDVYQTKSYTENLINYNRFLAILSGINKILDEILKTKE